MRQYVACRTSTRCAPEVRAESSEALERAGGDAAFARRLERFFTELRDPLVACTAPTSASRRRGRALLEADRATAGRARPGAARARPRARDHAGLAAPRAGGRLRHLRRPLRRDAAGRARAAALPARARRHLPAPHAAAARAARAQRRRLRGRRLRRGRARAGHDGRPARARAPTCARRAWRCASTSSSTTPRASTPGRRPRSPATSACWPSTAPSPTAREPDAYERTLPEVFPDIAPGNFTLGAGARPLGVDDVQRLPVGPRLLEPRGVRRDGGGDARAGERRRRRAAARRGAVPVEAHGDELPEPARGPRAAAGVPRADADRRARGRVQGRGDRLAARSRRLPRRRPPRGQGVRPRLPQRAHGAAVELAGVRPRGADDAARCGRCRRSRRARAG